MKTSHSKPENHRTAFFVHIIGFFVFGTVLFIAGDFAAIGLWFVLICLHFYIPERNEEMMERSASTIYRVLEMRHILLYVHLGCFISVAMFIASNTVSRFLGWYPAYLFSPVEMLILIPGWFAFVILHGLIVRRLDAMLDRK